MAVGYLNKWESPLIPSDIQHLSELPLSKSRGTHHVA